MPSFRRGLLAGLTATFAGVSILASAQQPKELRSVVWGRAREALGNYRTLTDISGLVDVDSNIPKNIDAENLAAVCQARDEGIRRARTWNEQLADRARHRRRPDDQRQPGALRHPAGQHRDLPGRRRRRDHAVEARARRAAPVRDGRISRAEEQYFATSEMLGATLAARRRGRELPADAERGPVPVPGAARRRARRSRKARRTPRRSSRST